MTYQASANKSARQPVWILEIDIPACSLTYGTSPCTASIGTTGQDRCYNTFSSCQVRSVYAPVTKTYRWSNVPLRDASLFPCVAGIESVDYAPTVITPGKGLSSRAQAVVTINDTPFPDYGIDPYVALRSYDVARQGTFWGKWLARNKFYNNKPARLKYGFLNDDGSYDPGSFSTYTFIVDAINWLPNSQGVTINLLDVLKLASDQYAQAPAHSNLFLKTAIAAGDTCPISATMSPAGQLATLGFTTGYIIIDNEIFHVSVTTGDVCTIDSRAQKNTTANGHSLDVKVQICVVYENQSIPDVIYDLLTTYGNIDPAYIDMTAWNAENASWLSFAIINAVLPSVSGVSKYLDDLCAHGLFYIWWNERTSMIDFRAVRPGIQSEIVPFNDTQFLAGQSKMDSDATQLVSAVLVFWGIIDGTKNLTASSNYLGGYEVADTDASGANEYGVTSTQFVHSRWFDSQTVAEIIANRFLARYKDALIKFTFQLDPRDATIWTGDSVAITSRYFQDVTGASGTVDADIISAQQKGNVFEYVALISLYQGVFGFWTLDSQPDYLAATPAQRAGQGYWTNAGGLNPDNSNGNQWS